MNKKQDKIFEVPMSFRHSYTMVVRANDAEEALRIAKANEGMQGDDKRVIAEGDGMFEERLSIDSPVEINEETFNKDWK